MDEALRAWHAGAGEWAGQGDVNSRSIGVELQNTVGRLLWRLEEAAAGPQVCIEHSAEARDPNG